MRQIVDISKTIATPDLDQLLTLNHHTMYGVKAHLWVSTVNPNGVKEIVRVAQDVDKERWEYACSCPQTIDRWSDDRHLHIKYRVQGASAYVGCGDVYDELRDEGYTDVRYSDDFYLLTLDLEDLPRLVRRGVLQTTGA